MTVTDTTSDRQTATERHRDIPEELADFELHDQDRDEDHHGRQCRHHDRTPDLACPEIGGVLDVSAFLPEAEDVLQHNDGRVDDHAHREARPASEITLMITMAAIATKEPMTETGIASEITAVAEKLRRKSIRTTAARTPPTQMFCCTRSMAETM